MKSFNIQYKNEKSLKDFIVENKIDKSDNILVQIFSGVVDEKYTQNIAKLLNSSLPSAQIIGTTTCGEILEGKLYDNSVTISMSVFDKTVVKSNFFRLDDECILPQMAEELIQDNTKVLIILSDGLKSDAERLLKEIYKLNPDIIIAGGRAGDNAKFEHTYVFNENQYGDNACVIATLSSDDLIVNNDYILNWTPLGKDMIVTKVKGNILYELDGIPILDVYAKYLGEDVAKGLPSVSMEFPLIVEKNHIHVARDPIAKTDDRALVFAGNFELGDSVRFSFGDTHTTSNENTFKTFSKFPSESIFIYSCAARKNLMGDKLVSEFNILQSISPTVGYFTYGEYFHGKTLIEILNVTTTFLVLSESSKVNECNFDDIPVKEDDIIKKALTNLIKVTNKELRYISTHDMLTAIYNRAEYIKRIELNIKSAKRYGENFGLMLIDIDFFKLVNDNYGHNVGDDVLRNFSQLLVQIVREDDFVARWGGEEFVIIVKYATIKTLEKLAIKIQKKVSEYSFEPVPRLTVSFGLSIYIKNDSSETLFKRVDNALYTAKNNGRNTYVIG